MQIIGLPKPCFDIETFCTKIQRKQALTVIIIIKTIATIYKQTFPT